MSASQLQSQLDRPSLSLDEEARLAALASLDILDTQPEERFDRLAQLAKDLLDVPTAYVSLIDRERQWYKARCGLDLTETAREDALCNYTIRFSGPTLALDTLEHPEFRNYRYVQNDPKVRFYLGYPLTVKGQPVGTLCTLDFQPRAEVTARQLAHMESLARIAETELLLKDTLETQELLLKHRNELKARNEFVRRVLGRYVTDEVAEHVLSAPEELHLGGERREVTVLMSDLRGFTVMSDRLSPETVVQVLNHYLHHMVEIALKWGGTIDEIIGDALLIIFGAPLPLDDHAARAAGCAIDMQCAIPEVNARLAAEGLPSISCGIGINTGEVVVGNIGSEKRMKYSVVGSPVNLTARIESLTIGGQILASEATTQALGERARIDGKLRVNMKGFDRPVTIYEIGGLDDLLVPEHA
jgi:adenylate cyclase